MDKYEYNLKKDQMKALVAEGNYNAAAEIADSINWRKEKNVNLLVKAGDIYAKLKRYDEAKEILLMAYDRSPIGRMIIYRLAEISIKMKDLEEAEEYYNKFVEIAPHDNLKYVLRYKMSRANQADLPTRIAILEELKEAEYTEEWAYQLAYLYHQAGEIEKCIDTCDELILWFGEGVYVERALELKMLYQPLSKAQEDKYRSFRQRRDGLKEVYPREETSVRIPVVQETVEKFNTANLQEELKKSMQQIMDATEKEAVDDTMDNIKKMVGEIPYLQMPNHEERAEETSEHIETDAEIDGSLRSHFQEMLSEDSDTRYGMPDENGTGELQSGGQMSIEAVLSGWEKTRRAAQAALQRAQQQKLESAKARAMREAEDIMDRLADVIPKLDAGITPMQLMQKEHLQEETISNEERAGRYVADMNQILQQQIDKLKGEARAEEETEHELMRKIKQAKPNFDEQIGLRAYVPTQFEHTPPETEPHFPEEPDLTAQTGDLPEVFSPQAPKEFEEPEELRAEPGEKEEVSEEERLDTLAADFLKRNRQDTDHPEEEVAELSEDLTEEMRLAEAEFYGVSVEELEQSAGLKKPPEDETVKPEASLIKQDTKEIRAEEIEQALKETVPKQPQVTGKRQENEKKQPQQTKLTEEQKAVFSYFVPVAGMERQICEVLSHTTQRFAAGKASAEGNILIQGGAGCGKTVFAAALIKALQKEEKHLNGKVGKIDAGILNKKDLTKMLKKVAGGCLIIERAGGISRETAVKLSLLLEQDDSGVLVIMEDTRSGLDTALGQDDGFAKKFTEKIKIPVFTSDELVEFGKAYAHDLDYEIDNMGVLALYNRISNIQRLDQPTTLTEVKEIVDEAIEKAEKKSLKKAFSIITSRRYTENDYILLREKDFEE
ncbi:RecBCD enzyme subunit RecD [Lachnospiraceae bacterium]|nr:RecBCD enzyme subunit RecD [Lachnospiraceae bacterium]